MVEHLVHVRTHAATAGPGVGDPEDLEQLLRRYRPRRPAVQGYERDVGRGLLEAPHEVRADVERDHLVAQRRERVLDPGRGAQRHLSLQRAPTLQHGDPHRAVSPRPRRRRRGDLGSLVGRRRRIVAADAAALSPAGPAVGARR